ncbi:MAG: hypothetical protein KY462_16100 [Actinobacteria bacterium]|nr:hypothetical protein [Actinomycetota bacterium]
MARTRCGAGSANFTVTDTHHNLNHLIVFHSAYVCRRYLDEVEQLRRGEFGRGRHGSVPAIYDLSGMPVKVLFAPDHTPELELVKQILKARKEIVFAIFTFAGSSGIDDALLAMADNPQIPSIRGVLDPAQAAHGWAAPRWLDHPKIELFVPEKAGIFASLRKVHHKLMVIDRRVMVAGSMNYTRPANDFNDENLFVIGSTHDEVEGIAVAAQPSRDLALHVRNEIERIIALSRPFHPSD